MVLFLIVLTGFVLLLYFFLRGDATEAAASSARVAGDWELNIRKTLRQDADQEALFLMSAPLLTPELRAPATMTYNIKLAVGFLQVRVILCSILETCPFRW